MFSKAVSQTPKTEPSKATAMKCGCHRERFEMNSLKLWDQTGGRRAPQGL